MPKDPNISEDPTAMLTARVHTAMRGDREREAPEPQSPRGGQWPPLLFFKSRANSPPRMHAFGAHSRQNSEIAQPNVNVADRQRHDHHGQAIEREPDEPEGPPAALGEPRHRQVRGGADQRAVAAQARAEREAPPQRLDPLRAAERR